MLHYGTTTGYVFAGDPHQTLHKVTDIVEVVGFTTHHRPTWDIILLLVNSLQSQSLLCYMIIRYLMRAFSCTYLSLQFYDFFHFFAAHPSVFIARREASTQLRLYTVWVLNSHLLTCSLSIRIYCAPLCGSISAFEVRENSHSLYEHNLQCTLWSSKPLISSDKQNASSSSSSFSSSAAACTKRCNF